VLRCQPWCSYPQLDDVVRLIALQRRVVSVLKKELPVLDVAKSTGLTRVKPAKVSWRGRVGEREGFVSAHDKRRRN